MEQLLFYDIEVFAKNAFVVFKSIDKKTVRIFHNDFTGLQDFVKDKTLVGYNNYWYDDHILHAMMDLKPPDQIKALNDRIIGGEKMRRRNYKFKSLDTFQQISPNMPSLKKIEANLGLMILESSVSFDYEDELSEEQYLEVLEYCKYDIDMTITVYKMRENNYFKPKAELVKMLGYKNAYRWNTTTLSANILTDKPMPRWFELKVPEELMELVPPEVAEMWRTKKKGHITINEFNNEIVFGFGGLHGQNTKKKRFENVYNLDVASLYPSIIVNYNLLGIATPKYKEILEERIRIKHSEPDRQAGLKLILNSVFGLLKSEYSLLFNKQASTTVCAIGQAILYDLTKRLSNSCEIVQINTDGVAFIPHNDDYKVIWEQWERDYNLTLEADFFPLFIQRDVNNYIAVEEDGYCKLKGGDVNRYYKDNAFTNNNARIIDIALVNKLVHKKDILETLTEHLDRPHLFQYVLQAGRTYLGTYDQDDNKYDRINRVFASKKPGLCLFKKRVDGGMVRYADAPMNMVIFNDDCSKLKDFDKIVDLNHYYQIITKKLERWM